MDTEFLAALEANSLELEAVAKTYEAKISTLQQPMRIELDAVLKQRQPICDAVAGFWGDRFKDTEGPLAQHLNSTCDPKVIRAITSFSIDTSVVGGKILRKVSIELKSNIFIESAKLERQIDQDNATVSCSGVQWKKGTEKMRGDSIFRFFDKEADTQFVSDSLLDFEELFQDPLNQDILGGCGDDDDDDFSDDDEEGSDYSDDSDDEADE